MPHLQEKNDAEEKVFSGHNRLKVNGTTPTNISSSELPIREAREGYLSRSEGLLSLAMTATNQKKPDKVESFESTEERTADNTTTPTLLRSKQFVSPSPDGVSGTRPLYSPYGPMLSVYGGSRILPSPIRVKRKVSGSEDERESESSTSPVMNQPTNLRYGEVLSMTTRTPKGQKGNQKKRPIVQMEVDEASKKAKPDRNAFPSSSAHNESLPHSPVTLASITKKAIISPSSSGEKGEDDDSTVPVPRGVVHSRPYDRFRHPPHFPPYSPLVHHHAYGAHPSPPYGYPPYGGYPPPSPYLGGHRVGQPPRLYPPYSNSRHHMMHPPRPHPFTAHYARSLHRGTTTKPNMGMAPMTLGEGAEKKTAKTDGSTRLPNDTNSPIKSVAEWQQASKASGKPPSANRCVPLEEPIPSRYWGEMEKTKDAVLPDFHRLVNYPDYLSKARNTSPDGCHQSGKKNCVMCGKLRACLASSLVNKSRSTNQEEPAPREDDSTTHIIPRQNKGLCTACDVSVWVVVADGMEIKWCKGCKNFRSWAAFGDKGSATKCVRCRDRQREKYAMQKDGNRLKRFKGLSRSDSASSKGPLGESEDVASEIAKKLEEQKVEVNHMAAARGLQNLMKAAVV